MEATRFAARYEPPTIVVEVTDGSRGGKLSLVRFELNFAFRSCKTSDIVTKIRRRLEVREVEVCARGRRKLVDLAEKLVDRQRAKDALAAGIDLNIVAPGVLEEAKKYMDKDFAAKALKPGDSGYVYNKKVDFGSLDGAESDNSWDD